MKKLIIIYIYLFSSFLHADESLDERKKRIMRKYLREQVTVFNSDIIMENPSEKMAIKDSEKMMIEDQEFLKHDKAVVPKMISPRITKKMYEQWNLKDDDFNTEKESIEESLKYEENVDEVEDSETNIFFEDDKDDEGGDTIIDNTIKPNIDTRIYNSDDRVEDSSDEDDDDYDDDDYEDEEDDDS